MSKNIVLAVDAASHDPARHVRAEPAESPAVAATASAD
jgi:hypothetical protein